MNAGSKHDLSSVSFAGTPSVRRPLAGARGPGRVPAPQAAEQRLDDLIPWVLGRAGRNATAYRPQPLQRRWPALLRSLALRRQVHWKVADLLVGVEQGPWDVLLWRNAAIYLQSDWQATIWRQLVPVLAPRGVLIGGKSDRPPRDAGLTPATRCIYRVADGPETGRVGRRLTHGGTT